MAKPQVRMRAKMIVSDVNKISPDSEELSLRAVSKDDGYDDTGSDENNTFSKFTPSADLTMIINNPDLVGTFKMNDTFYLDFTEA